MNKEHKEQSEGQTTFRPERHKWQPADGLSIREEEMIYAWLGFDSPRETMDQIATRECVSKTVVGRIVKRATRKLALIYRTQRLDSSVNH